MDHFKDLGEHIALVHLGPDLEEKIKVVVEAAK
jgi:ribosomal protein L9